MLKSKILIFFISFIVLINCDDIHQVIPYTQINISLDLNTDLAGLGVGSTIISPKNGGFMGVIIYRNSISEFYAFERTCTNYPNDTSAVVAEDNGVVAVCPKCGSTYIFTADGAIVSKGPARLPLKQYQTYLNDHRLFISN